MAKIRVTGVSYDQSTYTIMVTLVDLREVDGVIQDVPLGEAGVRFPSDMEMDDVGKLIVKTAEEIWKAHKNAVDKANDIADIWFPDIP